jgi:hypothetical protein
MLGASCSPCCPQNGCVVFKSEGWSGYINDQDTGTFYGNPINGDGWSNVVASSRFQQRPYVIDVWPLRGGVRLSFTIGLSSVQAKVEAAGGSIILETASVDEFLNGDTVEISSVVSNTTSPSQDEYGKSDISQVGKFFLRRAQQSECNCSCDPNYFAPSQPVSTPDTYTLQFTKTDSRPNGPRWPKPATPNIGIVGQYAIGKYAGFMPPNDVREYLNNSIVRTGCDSYLARISQPIVLRKVAGTNHTYLSDPINIKPCAQVRYRFDACPYYVPGGSGSDILPALSAFSVQSNSHKTHPSAKIFADAPLCAWNAPDYRQTPSNYQSAKDTHVYTFGDFATVTPGGTYQPEQQLLCGGSVSDRLSLAEGCLGTKCPPSALQVTIEGGDQPWIAGTYSVPQVLLQCDVTAGAFIPENYFDGSRGIYRGDYSSLNNLAIVIYRNESRGFQWYNADLCGCEQRTITLFVSWNGASTNTTRYPDLNECVPICATAGTQVIWNQVRLQTNYGGFSGVASIGKVTVTF